MKTKFFSIAAALVFFVCVTGKSQSVKIGNQEWTTENLNISTFRNGEPIFEAESVAAWKMASDGGMPAWCYYNVKDKKYGKLYNWCAVHDRRGLAPQGWHIPTDKEWDSLVNYLGGANEIGNKIKSKSDWENNDTSYNGSGFSAFPGGCRNSDGSFIDRGADGYFWSVSESSIYFFQAYGRLLSYVNSQLPSYISDKGCGFSVRCIKDISVTININQNKITIPLAEHRLQLHSMDSTYLAGVSKSSDSIRHTPTLQDNFTTDYDAMDNKTTYVHLNFDPYSTCIYAKVVETKSTCKIYFISNYHSDDWLFHTHIKVKIGDNSKETSFIEDGIRDILDDGGGINEKNYYPASDLYILKWIADNYTKEVTVRFYGENYYHTMTIPDNELIAIKETWALYKLLSDKQAKTVKIKKT